MAPCHAAPGATLVGGRGCARLMVRAVLPPYHPCTPPPRRDAPDSDDEGEWEHVTPPSGETKVYGSKVYNNWAAAAAWGAGADDVAL